MKQLHYYVYYRVDPAQVDALHAVTAALFRAVSEATGVQGRLLRRRDDPGTWMEIYENVADDAVFERSLEAALGTAGFARLQVARKTEIFQCA